MISFRGELSYSLPAIEQSIEEFYKDYKCGLPEEIKQGQKPPQKEYFLYLTADIG